MKGALLTLAQPLLNVIIPAFTALVNILTAVISKIASFIAMLFGTTYEDASKSAEALYNEQNAISGVGSAAKKASKSLAAFDEINKLTDNSTSSGGGGSGSGTIVPSFDTVALSEGMQNVLTIVEKIGAALLGWGISKLFISTLEKLVGLKFSKKVSIGISLVAAGGAMTAENIASILSGEYGATSLKSALSSAVSGLMIGAGLVAMGASLFVLPISIVAAFTITDLVVNWEQYKTMWSHELDAAKAFLAGDSESFWSSASDAFLVWLQTDSWTQKLGKALLGDDVWEQAIAYLENGGTFDRAFSQLWENVKEWFSQQTWSDLAANGFLGIGSAFAAWAETGFPPEVQKWIDWLKENFFNNGFFNLLGKESFSGLLDYLGGDFYKEWKSTWSDTGTALKEGLNGMITHFENFVNYCIPAVNRVIDAINSISSKGNGILSLFTIPSIPPVKLPRLATGAVIPPNREFMAVLGDQKSGNNIEAPEALIRRIVREESGRGGGNQTDEQNALLREQNELLRAILAKDTSTKLDGKTLLRSTERAARQRGSLIMAGGVTG